jgi:GTP-binding protein Era
VMYHEVPYALAVFVDKFEEKLKLVRIEATLNVERSSQKKILIGHKGEMLKKIGTAARKELEELFGTKVYLQTFVKVVPDWRESPQKVRELDWHFQLEGLSQGQWDGADPAATTEPPIDAVPVENDEHEPEDEPDADKPAE